MPDRKQYIEPILELLKDKQELARKEFDNTDLNNPGKYMEMENWFSEAKNMIVRTPPEFYVESLVLYEDAMGKIIRVEYEHCAEEMQGGLPSLQIIAELKKYI